MSKQTAIDYLVDKVEDFIGLIPTDIIEQAKEMERSQIIDAYSQGFIESETMDKGSEQYYNETYKK